jgi:cob(II)yrinic acid a,c-diamide reductase
MNAQPTTPQIAENFRTAMRQLAAGVTIVATTYRGEKRGLTATSVCSLSLEPPALVACVNHRVRACELIRSSKCFSVNVLGEEHEHLAHRFGGGEVSSGNRFDEEAWTIGVTGAPRLVESLASVDCELIQALEFTTHDILIGRAVDVHVGESSNPLLYQGRQYRRMVR